jgi:archaellum component FlaC
MLTKEDLQLLSQLMDDKLEPINKRLNGIDKRLDGIDERLDTIEENTEITRSVLNEVVKWIDVNFRDEYPFPTEDKQAI